MIIRLQAFRRLKNQNSYDSCIQKSVEMGLENLRWEFGELLVTRARRVDAVPLLSIHREVLEERSFFMTQPEEFSLDMEKKTELIQQYLKDENSIFLVAKSQRMPLGFLTLTAGKPLLLRHCASLEIMVAEKCRRQGIGRLLMTAAMEWAQNHPVIEKVKLAVFADNKVALDLYEKFGFQEEGRRIREYRLADGSYRDDILMSAWVG